METAKKDAANDQVSTKNESTGANTIAGQTQIEAMQRMMEKMEIDEKGHDPSHPA